MLFAKALRKLQIVSDLLRSDRMGEKPPKYQVEDILNKKKPPPQILDLNGIVLVFFY